MKNQSRTNGENVNKVLTAIVGVFAVASLLMAFQLIPSAIAHGSDIEGNGDYDMYDHMGGGMGNHMSGYSSMMESSLFGSMMNGYRNIMSSPLIIGSSMMNGYRNIIISPLMRSSVMDGYNDMMGESMMNGHHNMMSGMMGSSIKMGHNGMMGESMGGCHEMMEGLSIEEMDTDGDGICDFCGMVIEHCEAMIGIKH